MKTTPLQRLKWVRNDTSIKNKRVESDTWGLNALGVFLVFRARMASKINGLQKNGLSKNGILES
ncbi:TPA: hypothetical protein I7753_08670 [Vibrio vulnificus]|nr:hypothetical protein BJD94_06650 [Vibrio vulnificus Env1]EGQ9278677.1 hypothetical protein [Vibrio vulnificus]EGR0060869.1 hypothetical protein [Vibrio vulnificus]POC24732.1 hypothetical protein CRN42_07125 [Vibrio vulnificus]POC63102.1 hypothetical protein CRN56_21910 [Vibrio vulnificus Env1]